MPWGQCAAAQHCAHPEAPAHTVMFVTGRMVYSVLYPAAVPQRRFYVPRDGSVGKETFEKVEALMKEGKSKTEAFAQVASETGKNAGTVSANYYRVARANGSV